MTPRFTESMKRFARVVDLHDYLLANYPLLVIRDGDDRLRFKEHGSLIVTKGKGWFHNATGETGNSIDFLQLYLGMTDIKDIVHSLCSFGGWQYDTHVPAKPYAPLKAPPQVPAQPENPFTLPARETGSQARLYGYLCGTRGLSRDIVAQTVAQGTLYLAKGTNNAVWVSRDALFADQVGTLSWKSFKGILPGSSPDGYIVIDGRSTEQERKTEPLAVYVCEAVIDAMSFVQLHPRQVAVSMCGLKPGTLARIAKDYPSSEIVLAVDNDHAGDVFASKHPERPRSRPRRKDWNDDLKGGQKP